MALDEQIAAVIAAHARERGAIRELLRVLADRVEEMAHAHDSRGLVGLAGGSLALRNWLAFAKDIREQTNVMLLRER